MDRPWISTGLRVAEIHAADEPCYLVQRVLRVRPRASLDRDYCRLAPKSDLFYAQFGGDMTGVSVPHVSAEQIGTFPMPLPPVADQQKLAREVMEGQARGAELAARLHRQNELLAERPSTPDLVVRVEVLELVEQLEDDLGPTASLGPPFGRLSGQVCGRSWGAARGRCRSPV